MTAARRTFTWAALGALLLAWTSCGDNDHRMGGFSKPPVPEPTYRFGVGWDSLVVDSGQVKSGQSLSHLLDPAGIGREAALDRAGGQYAGIEGPAQDDADIALLA